MTTEIKVPQVGDSITEVQIGAWLKREGDWVKQDENLVELETGKATQELPSPTAGRVTQLLKAEGEWIEVGGLIAVIDESAAPPQADGNAKVESAAPSPTVAAATMPTAGAAPAAVASPNNNPPRIMPAAQRELADRGLRAEEVTATGPGGRLLKEDVQRHVAEQPAAAATAGPSLTSGSVSADHRLTERVAMTAIRRQIANRLVQAQQQAALLTTFNEVDMSAVMDLRKSYQEEFQAAFTIKLGFMSFFVKAVVEAVRKFPQVNARIDGNEIVYHHYCDIGIAVGSGKGLVVPVLRNAERLGFAEVEQQIKEFASRAQAGKITNDDMVGGTFTISNGGIYGSMLSTPIINPPQSAILGLHAIQDRPVARNGQVVIRPMMYLALSYDHRLIDGREAVSFLKHVKDVIENPVRILLEI